MSIVFSERCTLKTITTHSQNVKVIERNDIIENLKQGMNNQQEILSEKKVIKRHWKLAFYRKAINQVKQGYLKSIRSRDLNRSFNCKYPIN